MEQELTLFEMQSVYNLKTIEENTRIFIRKKFPKPVEEEDMDSYIDFINDEYKLELASRLREIADRLEDEALKGQREMIRVAYSPVGTLELKS